MIETDRLTTASVQRDEEWVDKAIRPKLLSDYISEENLTLEYNG